MSKLGIIAGSGALPREVAESCRAGGRPVFVVRLKGFADDAMLAYPGAEFGMAEFGHIFKALKSEGAKSVCFAGAVDRPDFASLKPDMRGLLAMPGIIAAARKGDDAILRQVMGEFEKEGFAVEGAHQVVADLALGEGALGSIRPRFEHDADMARALEVARAIGQLDIGQGAVVARGLVLAVEAQEGTDAMLRRCAELPAAVRGTLEERCGVLAKAPKPIQERRIDLPTIGVSTVRRAAKAGLAGIVGEAGGVLVVDREAVIAEADAMGLFVYGAAPAAGHA
ncbi:MAG: UDP-2,3-diacylglucosamine pyrophosphatase [Caulobacterales bacterium 68-7]|nr:UDP-2,3-diacylglucosamine diphosphatase LpxI [Caulobacterales bacterium]OJU09982.1 MAG: UDP-2,3-diacylglucosamine pyrophosphatase [Caulobacterales bacterium 68-7]